MSDIPTSKAGLGVQAYRWLVIIGFGVLTALSARTLSGIDETAKAVTELQRQVSTMQGTTESRFNAHAERLSAIDRRNDTQDSKIDGIWQRLWSFQNAPPINNPRATP